MARSGSARRQCLPAVLWHLRQPADDAGAAGLRTGRWTPPDSPPDAGERAPFPAEAAVQADHRKRQPMTALS